MIKAIISALTGGIGQSLADAYKARNDAQTEQQRIDAEVRIARIEASRSRGKWFDALTFVAGFPFAIHAGCVAFVSAFPMAFPDWVVHALPAPMNEWQGSIILSLFGLSAIRRMR